jgi:hypothetical protein
MKCEIMNLNASLDPIWLIVIVGFFYESLFVFFLLELRQEMKRIEEEELIRMFKKKYKD